MKKVKILIITLVSILIVGCITFAILYFATDIFKSDKDLFLKYAGQINLDEFIDLEGFNSYIEKTKTKTHSNEGTIAFNMDVEENSMNESIKYNGYSDPVSNKSNYDISINNDNETLLQMNYLRNQDLYGVLFKDIVNQYIVVDNNDWEEYAAKVGLDGIDNILDKIQFSKNIDLSKRNELKTVFNKYIDIAVKAIPEEKYSKIEKEKISLSDNTEIEADGYKIKLKIKDLLSISKKVLENAKNDEQLFNLIKNDDMTFESYQANIQQSLDTVSQEITDEQNINILTITIYKQGKNTVKFSIKLADEEETIKMEVAFEKLSKGMSLIYDYFVTTISGTNENKMTITKTNNSKEQEVVDGVMTQLVNGEEQLNSNINITRNGDYTSDNVSFDVAASIKNSLEDINVNISLNNTSNFSASPQFEEFKEGNYLVINKLSEEQSNNLFRNLWNLLTEKLNKKDFFITFITSKIEAYTQFESAYKANQNTSKEGNGFLNGITGGNESITSQSSISSLETQKVQAFNSQFTSYEGIRKGAEIKSLQNMVNASNAANTQNIVAYSGVSNEAIDTSKTYKVSFERDAGGYINKVIVEEN